MITLQTQSLTVQIADTLVCKNLNLSVKQGENWAVMGMNGSGKTTLLHTLAGLLTPRSGEIILNDEQLSSLSRNTIAQKLGLLLQHHEDHFPGEVLETVLIGRHPHLKSWQWESEHDKQIALDALAQVGLAQFSSRSILTLSGGERQRVALATLLAQQTPVRLLDEPVNHLDIHHQHEILTTLTQQQGTYSQLFVLHDINLAAHYCDHALLLFGEGETLSGTTEEVLTTENLSRLYQHPIHEFSEKGKRWFITGS